LDKQISPEWILETDIARCFDQMDHQFLIENTPICDKTVLESWIKAYPYFRVDEINNKGISQGWGIYPILCNIILNGIERHVLTKFKRKRKKNEVRPKVNVIRYADYIIITRGKKEILNLIRTILEEFLAVQGLNLKEAKIRVTHIDEGFNFIGYNIQRRPINRKFNKMNLNKDKVLIIQPTKKAIESIKRKIKNSILIKHPIERVIKNLNPVLREWAEYFRISYHSKDCFIKLGHYVYQKIWRWARLKHKRMTAKKVFDKYIISKSFLKGKRNQGQKWTWGNKNQKLFNFSEVTTWIKRPIKLDLNPYLLENKDYFETRNRNYIEAKFRAKIYKLFNHTCPICGVSLHNEEKIELHHIKSVKAGGGYQLDNILPLHQLCHKKVTYGK